MNFLKPYQKEIESPENEYYPVEGFQVHGWSFPEDEIPLDYIFYWGKQCFIDDQNNSFKTWAFRMFDCCGFDVLHLLKVIYLHYTWDSWYNGIDSPIRVLKYDLSKLRNLYDNRDQRFMSMSDYEDDNEYLNRKNNPHLGQIIVQKLQQTIFQIIINYKVLRLSEKDLFILALAQDALQKFPDEKMPYIRISALSEFKNYYKECAIEICEKRINLYQEGAENSGFGSDSFGGETGCFDTLDPDELLYKGIDEDFFDTWHHEIMETISDQSCSRITLETFFDFDQLTSAKEKLPINSSNELEIIKTDLEFKKINHQTLKKAKNKKEEELTKIKHIVSNSALAQAPELFSQSDFKPEKLKRYIQHLSILISKAEYEIQHSEKLISYLSSGAAYPEK